MDLPPIPNIFTLYGMLDDFSKTGFPEESRDESPDAAIARNRIAEIVSSGAEVQSQAPMVPESAYVDPEGLDDLVRRAQAMSVDEVTRLHQRWESMRDQLEQGMRDFSPEMDRAIEGRWEGAAAEGVGNAIREYVDKSRGLVDSVQIVAEKVKIIRSAIEITRPAVQEAPEPSLASNVLSWVPGPTWKMNEHREQAAHDASVNVIRNVFYPAVRETDSGVPLVPEPYNPVHDPGTSGTPTGPSPTSTAPGTTTPTSTAPGTTTENPDATPAGTDPEQTTDRPVTTEQQQTTPASTETPTGTTPANTVPTGTAPTTTPSPTTTTDPSIPRSTAPSPTGATPLPSGTPATTPQPGRSIPGTPSATTPAAAAANRATATRTGTTGMPGMFAPGANRGRGDDDKESGTKDYLVNQQNGEELTGLGPDRRPRTVPPVIGE